MSDPSIPFGATLNPQRGFFHKVYKKPACRTCTLPFETHVPNQKDCHECVAERVRQELLRSTI
jgi:hypothetical protein